MSTSEVDPFSEIAPGLVLHLDPDELERRGATYTCPRDLRVQGGHFFLCLEDDGSTGRWLPLYSSTGPGRFLLTGKRLGHPKWTSGAAYFHPGQVWTADHAAVAGAAAAGNDRSSPGTRNTLDPADIPNIPVESEPPDGR